jgi:hypothetical protein
MAGIRVSPTSAHFLITNEQRRQARTNIRNPVPRDGNCGHSDNDNGKTYTCTREWMHDGSHFDHEHRVWFGRANRDGTGDLRVFAGLLG